MDLNDKRQELGRVVKQARDIMELAAKEKRAMAPDEKTNYENLDKDIDRLEAEIRNGERLAEKEANLAKVARATAKDIADPEQEAKEKEERAKQPRGSEEFRKAFGMWLREGRAGLGAEEIRALSVGVDAAGGFLAPTMLVETLIKAIDDSVYMRQLATKFSLPNAVSMGAPSLDADPADADWTSEIATGTEDSTMAFGRRELTPHPLAKRIKVSNKLLRVVPNVEKLVMDRLRYKFAISEEKAFLTGSGVQQPLGVFTASADGISTARDVVTGSGTNMTGDGLINALYALKEGYMNSATLRWGFHRDGVKKIRLLKDSGTPGQYLWQPGLQGGQPSMILDKPYFMSEYVPNTFTSGLYVGIVGDFSYYWIADSLSMAIQRLVELYAETNQTGFIGRLETDGMPVLEEAFVRLKCD